MKVNSRKATETFAHAAGVKKTKTIEFAKFLVFQITIHGEGNLQAALHTEIRKISIKIPDDWEYYAEKALIRLGYIYPSSNFTLTESDIDVETAEDPELVRREVLHAIYRERILSETEDLRSTLIRALVSK